MDPFDRAVGEILHRRKESIEKEADEMSMKEERTRAGLSQSALSRASGVPLRTVQHWERGNVMAASARSLLKAANALGCTLDDLVRGEEDAGLASETKGESDG